MGVAKSVRQLMNKPSSESVITGLVAQHTIIIKAKYDSSESGRAVSQPDIQSGLQVRP